MAKESDKKLTKFEQARILGARSLQVALGAPPLIKKPPANPMELAETEFEKKKIPMIVVRRIPGGDVERVEIN